ncbi:MAG: AAA family ATPase [Fuerstiella sp.]
MVRKTLDSLATSIRALKDADDAIHIKALRFPNYRNLEPNAKLPFEFPITVLLGRNGCNKSSILHALHGCQKRSSVSDFWFETQLDAIPKTVNGLKQSFTHTYLRDGRYVECIKARAPRGKSDPDYWEAVKPTRVYGFPPNARREPPIDCAIVHLDFRGELPAFDKYFYFPDPSHLASRSAYAKRRRVLRREYKKQDYLRQRSRRLRNHLEQHGSPIPADELEVLKYILERNYLSGTILKHSLFHGHEGWTIQFRTPYLSGGYSDAFAGSGESAAALLVHNILSVKDRSIVLLDEPETSLHPRAQTRLLEFIAHYAVRKSLQVVMATHSIHLAEKLPPSAIRVLEPRENDKVSISTSHSPREALHEIGTATTGKTVIVEDERAKHIVISELNYSSPKAASEVRVVVRDGGTSRIFRDIQAYANADRRNIFVVLDGDHRPEVEVPADADLPQGIVGLKKLISAITSGPNKNGPKLDFVDEQDCTRFIQFFRRNVRFLPGSTPESLVWDEASAEALIDNVCPGQEVNGQIGSIDDSKKRLELLADRVPGMEPLGVFQFLLGRFLASDVPERQELHGLVKDIREREE